METIYQSSNSSVSLNNNFSTISEFACYLQNPSGCSGLTWAYYGVKWGSHTVTPSTITLTNNATNYLTVNRSTGALSASTLTDSWDDFVNHARVYVLTTSGGNVTAIDPCYTGKYGVHGHTDGGSFSGGGGSGGSVKLYPDATELLAESANTVGVRELNDSAAETTPTTITGTANNNTVQIGPAFENGQVNSTTLAGGEWTVELYSAVDNTAGDTRAIGSLYLKKSQTGTVTITGSPGSTSRTATVTGATPFIAGHANADVSKCAYLRTPAGNFRITAYTSSTVVTIETKTGYSNESGVAYFIDEYIGQGISAELNNTSVAVEIIEFFFNDQACSTTDKAVFRFFAKTTATANRTVTVYYGGTSNYTNLHTTLGFQHNDLVGLNTGDLLHLTAVQYAETSSPSKVYQVQFIGKPANSLKTETIIPFAWNIPANGTGCNAYAQVAATAQTDFLVQKNGSTIGTIRFAAAGQTATLVGFSGSPVSFNGTTDRLALLAPASQDATLADIGFNIFGRMVI